MSKLISEEDKLKAEQEAKAAEEKRIADEKAAADLAEAEAKKLAGEQVKAALDALGVSSKPVAAVKPAEVESAPKSNLDMLREQQAINERINYQAAQVKGQTFVRGK